MAECCRRSAILRVASAASARVPCTSYVACIRRGRDCGGELPEWSLRTVRITSLRGTRIQGRFPDSCLSRGRWCVSGPRQRPRSQGLALAILHSVVETRVIPRPRVIEPDEVPLPRKVLFRFRLAQVGDPHCHRQERRYYACSSARSRPLSPRMQCHFRHGESAHIVLRGSREEPGQCGAGGMPLPLPDIAGTRSARDWSFGSTRWRPSRGRRAFPVAGQAPRTCSCTMALSGADWPDSSTGAGWPPMVPSPPLRDLVPRALGGGRRWHRCHLSPHLSPSATRPSSHLSPFIPESPPLPWQHLRFDRSRLEIPQKERCQDRPSHDILILRNQPPYSLCCPPLVLSPCLSTSTRPGETL